VLLETQSADQRALPPAEIDLPGGGAAAAEVAALGRRGGSGT